MDLASSRKQEAGTSSRASGKDKTRGAWRGSDVTQYEIDWLYRSRRIPEGVTCRLPRGEIQPVLEPGEAVVFLAHFERGFGLPASDFFRQFLDFYRLQPHHLPGNAVFYLSCFVAFMEGYIGIRPARETFARFFSLRINSVQGKDIPAPKPPVQCGSCIIGSRQGSPFFKFNGLESCRLWQTTFFYVKNAGDEDLINLPAFNPAPPTKTNWQYNPGRDHAETNRVVRFMQGLMKDTNICSDDIIRAFISRRVLPLQQRAHKISEMYGPGDPTKITGLALSKKDVVLKASQICQTDMPDDWEWGLCPLSARNPPSKDAKARFPRIDSDRRGPCRKRPLDKYDPDPVIHWLDLRMGRTPSSRLGKSPPEPAGSSDDLTILETFPQPATTHRSMSMCPPCKPRLGMSSWITSWPKARRVIPGADAGPSHAPSGKRPRTEVIGGKQVGTKRYKQKRMPMSSALHLSLARRLRRPRLREYFNSSSSFKSALSEKEEETDKLFPHRAGYFRAGLSSSSRGHADTAAQPRTFRGQAAGAVQDPQDHHVPRPGLPAARPWRRGAPASGDVVLHVGPAALAAQDKPTGLLGRIVDLKRAGKDLGHLLPYAQKWNEADISASTRGLGTPSGARSCRARSTEEHFTRLKRAVKEFDSACLKLALPVPEFCEHLLTPGSNSLRNFVEHRDLAEAHSHCQGEKEQLLKEHNEALEAQKTALGELKEQAIQAALRHEQALKDAKQRRPG
ncbi:hypothetical protein QYE76_045767 [Lolium multiflorum]|uniref:Transposase (putative) gypsy type domain-containing protein n=1 Tax=Lolium multiflorum TaxID=4521 RepID=A0AAD8WYI5_LOLMU|nr:hypothetical protein QYE76_045767 [Lolium multiflorum]